MAHGAASCGLVPAVALTMALLAVTAGQVRGAVRSYFISAEMVEWDYAPHGKDLCKGADFEGDSAVWTVDGLGSAYSKAVYQAYTDGNFTERVKRPESEEHLGILGPLLRAEVGDTVRITFRNALDFPTSIAVQGVVVVNASEAAQGVTPLGGIAEYTWEVPETAGPGWDGPSSKLWMYHSGSMLEQMHAGMFGPLIVTAAGQADEDGKPKDVDREFVTLFQVINENSSPYTGANMDGHEAAVQSESDEEAAAALEEGNLKHMINGRIFCNLDGLNATVGDKVRWHVAGSGNEVDMHTPHWHGLVFTHNGRSRDEVMLIPGESAALDGVMDNPGSWFFHCHVNDHLVAGMSALVHVDGEAPDLELDGVMREYFIAVEEVEWDYTPRGQDLCGAEAQEFGEDALVFCEEGEQRFGSRYLKAVYVEYTDDTFKTRKDRSADEAHMGSLGPLMRAEVGDTLVIHFKNKLSEHPASMHAHGVWYDKSSEGNAYNDGTSGAEREDDAVPTGGNHTYVWKVPERAAPGPKEPLSKVWMYHSHTDEVADTYAGLEGAIVVTAKGNADEDGKAKDVDREFVLFFQVFDEGSSLLYGDNVAAKWGPDAGTSDELAALEGDDEYLESNLMHAVNGMMYCNLPELKATEGERVRVYMMGLGTEVDLHTPTAGSVTWNLQDTTAQALSLMPGAMQTADLVASRTGSWVVECNVADHIIAGMRAKLTVAPGDDSMLQGDGEDVTYYIAAYEVEWNYTPHGRYACDDAWVPHEVESEDMAEAATWINQTDATIGSTYLKALYRGYTDDSFAEKLPADEQAGILGPTMRVAVGDTLTVVFRNNLPFEVNIAPMGGLLPLNNATQDALDDSAKGVAPGETVQYKWMVPEDAVDPDDATGMVAFLYTSTVDYVAHSNAGLIGMIAVEAQRGPEDQRLIPALFMIQNENASPYHSNNLESSGIPEVAEDDAELHEEANLKHCINGYLFCNMPDVQLPLNSTTRWLLAALGSEGDLHSPLFEGQAVALAGQPISSPGLLPAMTRVVDVTAQTPGHWQLRCEVEDHIMAGMRVSLHVSGDEKHMGHDGAMSEMG